MSTNDSETQIAYLCQTQNTKLGHDQAKRGEDVS